MSLSRAIAFTWIVALGCTNAMSWAQAVSNSATSPSPEPALNIKSAATNKPGPGWYNLSATQKNALSPLAPHWDQISPAQKNKWLAISANFDKLSDKEQSVLHDRMADWAALSPQQRALARLTFNETKNLGADEKKSQWEAYQALSTEDRKKLAAQQTTGIQGAATASKAPPPHKIMRLPSKSAPSSDKLPSSTSIVIDKKTLLPTTVTIPEGT